MNSYQPQQQQQQYRANQASLWLKRKTVATQPDYDGSVEISWALLQELTAAFNAGQYEQDSGGQPCIKLDIALYGRQPSVSSSGRQRPVLYGRIHTLADTQQSAAMRQQARQQYAASQPQQPQYAPQQPAQQPQYPASAPMPAQAQPAHQQLPQQPQPAPQLAYQQAPQAPASMPQPPAAPAPMPGAIHGQPPAAPAPWLPQGF